MTDNEAEAWDDLLFGRGEDDCTEGKVCNRCGESYLHWIQVKDKWCLANDKEEIHMCKRGQS